MVLIFAIIVLFKSQCLLLALEFPEEFFLLGINLIFIFVVTSLELPYQLVFVFVDKVLLEFMGVQRARMIEALFIVIAPKFIFAFLIEVVAVRVVEIYVDVSYNLLSNGKVVTT